MLSFRTDPQPRYLVENPIIFNLATDSQSPVELEISFAPNSVPIYRGIYTPSGKNSDFKVDISVNDIIKTFMPEQNYIEPTLGFTNESGISYQTIYIQFNQDSDTLNISFMAYPGGISKRFMRYLLEKNTDIFTYKLLNTYKQFLLTTRTASRHIFIRESELCPLFFIGNYKIYTVETEHGSIAYTTSNTPAIYSLHLQNFRNHELNVNNCLTQFFNFKYNGNPIFDITIIPSAPVPNIYIIEFINSYGVPERLEVSGRKTSAPELKSDETYDRYDPDVDDYIEQNDRVQLREIINAEFGYKTLDEFFFARDMLQSSKRYLIDSSGSRTEVRVKSESYEHDLHPITPGSVPLTISFVDTETEFSPIPDESLPEGGIPVLVTFHGNGGKTTANDTTVTLEVTPGTPWSDIIKPEFLRTGKMSEVFSFIQGDDSTIVSDSYSIVDDVDVYALYKVVIRDWQIGDDLSGKNVFFNTDKLYLSSNSSPNGSYPEAYWRIRVNGVTDNQDFWNGLMIRINGSLRDISIKTPINPVTIWSSLQPSGWRTDHVTLESPWVITLKGDYIVNSSTQPFQDNAWSGNHITLDDFWIFT